MNLLYGKKWKWKHIFMSILEIKNNISVLKLGMNDTYIRFKTAVTKNHPFEDKYMVRCSQDNVNI